MEWIYISVQLGQWFDDADCASLRFVVGSNRAIFMLRDGSYAWEIKDFLVGQERCSDVTVEGQVFPGKAAKKDGQGKEQNEASQQKKSKNGDKKSNKASGKSRQEL